MTKEQKHFLEHSWITDTTLKDLIERGIEEAYEDDAYYYILPVNNNDESYMINKKTQEVRKSNYVVGFVDPGLAVKAGRAKPINPPYRDAFNA